MSRRGAKRNFLSEWERRKPDNLTTGQRDLLPEQSSNWAGLGRDPFRFTPARVSPVRRVPHLQIQSELHHRLQSGRTNDEIELAWIKRAEVKAARFALMHHRQVASVNVARFVSHIGIIHFGW